MGCEEHVRGRGSNLLADRLGAVATGYRQDLDGVMLTKRRTLRKATTQGRGGRFSMRRRRSTRLAALALIATQCFLVHTVTHV